MAYVQFIWLNNNFQTNWVVHKSICNNDDDDDDIASNRFKGVSTTLVGKQHMKYGNQVTS